MVNKYPGYFIVNYEVYEVIYTEGYENANGLWCYKISDLNKMPEIQNPVVQNNQQNQITEDVQQQDATQTTEGNASTQTVNEQ